MSNTMSSGGDDLDLQLQPHLAGSRHQDAPNGLENPDLAVGEEDVTVSFRSSGNNGGMASSSTSSKQHWERFDDDDVSAKDSGKDNSQSSVEGNGRLPPPPPSSRHSTSQTSTTAQQTATQQQQKKMGQPPVLYNCQSGVAAVVVPAAPVGNGVAADTNGAPRETTAPPPVIQTQHIPERWAERERPLRARQMKLLKVLGVVAAILFPPTGIPAAIYAWRTKREFDAGIMRGNIDRAQKLARRTERLIILSGILLILVAVLIFALVERANFGYPVDHSYLAHNSVQG